MDTPFAYRVKAARIQRGDTQAELAQALGVSKQAVSQYEHGRKKPDSTTLIALARYFGKPTGYFFRPLRTPLEQVDFRKKASLQGNKLAAVKASILDRLEPYLELEEILGVDTEASNPLAEPLITSGEEAEAAATRLRQAWDLGLNPIPNVLEMLELQGIKVVEVALSEDFDGLSTWVNDQVPVVVLNQGRDLLRKRFTALHELGHLFLAFPPEATPRFKEKACNRFAGAMLLPASVLKRELGETRQLVSLAELIPLKQYHGISLAAIVYRGNELKLLSDRMAKRFWQQRKQDPELLLENTPKYGAYQGEERAYRFEQLLSKALSEALISFSKAAELSGKTLSTLRQSYQPI
jgi:Zn-dependent peptidase ImmA (M78 family)/DNA-binding XRE family transcriptional regulator